MVKKTLWDRNSLRKRGRFVWISEGSGKEKGRGGRSSGWERERNMIVEIRPQGKVPDKWFDLEVEKSFNWCKGQLKTCQKRGLRTPENVICSQKVFRILTVDYHSVIRGGTRQNTFMPVVQEQEHIKSVRVVPYLPRKPRSKTDNGKSGLLILAQ